MHTAPRPSVANLALAARRLLLDDSGQGLVEYALIITFTALLAIVALRTLGGRASNSLTNASNNLS